MRSRALILTALLLLLGAIAYLGFARGWCELPARRPDRLVFAEVRPDEVSDIIFVTEEKLRLLRKHGKWRIIEPVNVRADEAKISALISQLTGLQYLRPLGSPRREYRLEPWLEFATDRNRYGLSLGKKAAGGRYLAVNGRAYLVTDFDPVLSPTLENLRNRRLSYIDGATVTQVMVTSPDFSLHLERRDGWHVAGQAWKRIDPLKVEALINSFVRAEALKCEREMQGRDPDVVLEFITSDGQRETFRIWFGCPVFAEVPAIDGVVELDPALTRLIPDSVSDLFDLALIKPEAQRIRRIRLSQGGRSCELRRSGESFLSAGSPVATGRIGRLLVDLRRLEGEESSGATGDDAKPVGRITIYYSSKKPAFDIVIYSNYYLALDGRTYRVRPQDLKALQPSLGALISATVKRG